MSLTDVVPVQYRLAAYAALAVITGLALWGATEYLRHEGVVEGRAQVQTDWDKERATLATAALRKSQENAQETQRRLAAQKEAQDAHDQELAHARADAASAHAALVRLRERAAQYAAGGGASGHPATGGDGAAAGAPAGVLADVLGRLGSRAELLAAYADAARRAGLQCERDYDSLRDVKR